jgi:hypothetical protein
MRLSLMISSSFSLTVASSAAPYEEKSKGEDRGSDVGVVEEGSRDVMAGGARSSSTTFSGGLLLLLLAESA